MYSKAAVLDWLHRTLGVNNQPNKDEAQTDCPKCGGNVLYFNVRKQLGKCHKASCEWNKGINLYHLIEEIGFSPDQGGEWDYEEEKAKVPEFLPGHPILIWAQNQMLTSNEQALAYLRRRGLEDNLILNWGLTCDGERIYVPIYNEDGLLVNYNSRILPGYDSGDPYKYLYYKGAETGGYILGWKECRNWTDLALVENTFVSLSYRYRMHCSTTFGSNVTDRQADAISKSGVRTVALLWDENAERGADRAIRKLADRGVRAAAWRILGQPDDYPIEWVEQKAKLVKENAATGDADYKWLDVRDECAKLREERRFQ